MSDQATRNGTGKPPTTERGSIFMDPGFMPQWASLMSTDELEENEKLTFPTSIQTYHNMRTDPQVQGLLTGAIWPLLRMGWFIRPNGAKAEIVDKISKDLNLPVGNDWKEVKEKQLDNANFNLRRTQNRFNFLQHLEEALDAIAYGFAPFEQVGYIGDDGLFHYKKLALRPPHTVMEINVEKDGGVKNIRQGFADSKPMPINRLVIYSFQKRGANWHGRSMLRGCYGPYLLKDRAMRVGVMNIQRAGVGTPVAQGHPGATDTELRVLENFAQRFVAGDKSGGAIPYGATMKLIGVEGTQPDTVGFIKLMNEEMARSFFQMFMQLGQTTSGSRALGQTFVQYHKLVTEYLAQWFSMIFNEHVIEDDIEWNYGPSEEYAPLLSWAWDEPEPTELGAGGQPGDQAASHDPPANKLQLERKQAAANPSKKLQQSVKNGKVQASSDVIEILFS